MESIGFLIFLIFGTIIFFVIMLIVIHSNLNHVTKKIDYLQKDIYDLKHLQNQKSITETNPIQEIKTNQQEEFDTEKISQEHSLSALYHTPSIIAIEPTNTIIPKQQVDNKETQSTVEKEPVMIVVQEEFEETIPTINSSIKQESNKHVDYEQYIGGNLFGKIGILVLVVGIGFFVKYAIDNNWINETLRTILGYFIGIILLIIAQKLQHKYRMFSSLLAGGTFAIFYVTTAIAFHYYKLFPQPIAFVILVLTAIGMSALGVWYNRRELAIIALIGGFIAPFLINNGQGNYIGLFTYITILNMAMLVLSIYKKWSELPIISFVFTYAIMGIYLLNVNTDDAQFNIVAIRLFYFVTGFYLIFLLPIVSILKSDNIKINYFLNSILIANNFVYLGFAIFFLKKMNLSFNTQGILAINISIVNFLLMLWVRKKSTDIILRYTLLGVVLTFVSISIPLQFDGNFIVLAWGCEMIILLWLYIKSKIKLYGYTSIVMLFLTMISFLKNSIQFVQENYWTDCESPINIIFLNGVFATSFFVALALGVFAWLMYRYQKIVQEDGIINPSITIKITSVLSILIGYYTFIIEICRFSSGFIHEQWVTLFSISYIFGLMVGFHKWFSIQKYLKWYIAGILVSVVFFVIDTIDGNTYFVSKHTVDSATYSITHMGSIWLKWITIFIMAGMIFFVGKFFYKNNPPKKNNEFTAFLAIISTIVWLVIGYRLHIRGENNVVFSIALGIAGFVQMALGMRLHIRILRIVSLYTFGIILAKLLLIDLWKLPSLGKILVFVFLGILLLVMSFLYQKLKDVLLKEDNQQTDSFIKK